VTHTEITSSIWPPNDCLPDREEQKHAENVLPVFKSILSEEKIPYDENLFKILKNIYIPLCAYLTNKHKNKPLIIGINGSQGSGKSTITKILQAIIETSFKMKVVSFSIDDLYLTKNQRESLAKETHPLLITRGVPGTHDVKLGISILRKLLEGKHSEIRIPRFDKSIDDRLPEPSWSSVNGTCDIIIFEGWCVGSQPEDDKSLETPINELEKQNDTDGKWREYVNQELKNSYSELFSLIDILVMLKIPSFEKVYEWRKLQEQKLKSTIGNRSSKYTKIMCDSEIERFIMHYERVTRHSLNEMPKRSDIVLELGNNHNVKNIIIKNEA